jgi:predicted site-specific integrase-resolvase
MDGLMNLKEVARRADVSYSTIRVWFKAGILPPPSIERPNHRKYWTSDQIEKWWCQLSPVVASQSDQDGSLKS